MCAVALEEKMCGHRTLYWVAIPLLLVLAGCVSGENQGYQPDISPQKPHYYYDVLVYDEYLYAVSPWGLDIFSIGAGSLRRIGGFRTPGEAQTLAVSGRTLYVSDTLGKLYLLDVSTPAQPQLLAEVVLNHTAQKIVISGNSAFLACVASGLVVLDLATLSQRFYKPGNYSYPKGVSVRDRTLYLADFTMRLYVARLRKNGSLEFLGFVPTSSVAHDVLVRGSHAYVASSDAGVDVYRISPDGRLVHQQNLQLPGFALRLASYRDYLLVTLANSGVALLRIHEDGRLEPVAEYDTPGNAYGIAVAEGSAYVADYDGGIVVLDLRHLPERLPVRVVPPEVGE
ncbi:MAG: PQQ-binding-like beta-propeller repeat protein [Euryarchaeota archaeon]|nr:PQQ-binding-like beta-propeller repeat protein [Euryarchaeota archaeon]